VKASDGGTANKLMAETLSEIGILSGLFAAVTDVITTLPV
jgi:hypothetical protein